MSLVEYFGREKRVEEICEKTWARRRCRIKASPASINPIWRQTSKREVCNFVDTSLKTKPWGRNWDLWRLKKISEKVWNDRVRADILTLRDNIGKQTSFEENWQLEISRPFAAKELSILAKMQLAYFATQLPYLASLVLIHRGIFSISGESPLPFLGPKDRE